ncbi:helix-turn-helix domain-containing protein [Streptomyces parvulus]|uniref:helix-turn-helix domain-containing protein n=1 Tax=Streptomyces parvulus TaxID=146923 RepID=UPI0033FE4A31
MPAERLAGLSWAVSPVGELAAALVAVAEARTTTALAALHHLAPATVSFHLSRLLAADMVHRTRTGRHVHYHHTAPARAFLRPSPESGPGPVRPCAGASTTDAGQVRAAHPQRRRCAPQPRNLWANSGPHPPFRC